MGASLVAPVIAVVVVVKAAALGTRNVLAQDPDERFIVCRLTDFRTERAGRSVLPLLSPPLIGIVLWSHL